MPSVIDADNNDSDDDDDDDDDDHDVLGMTLAYFLTDVRQSLVDEEDPTSGCLATC